MDKENNNMEKGDLLKSFQSQFDPTIPSILQRTSCGIASLYMGLKYLGKEVGEYPQFLRRFIAHGSFNIPMYSMNLNIAGVATKVPISYFNNEQKADEQAHINEVLSPFSNLNLNNTITREENPNASPRRAFTIEHGFDHRGVGSFVKEELGFNNMMVELIETEKLPNVLAENSVILASVQQDKLGYPARLTTFRSAIATHVIPIVGIGQFNETNLALFGDSAFLNAQDGLQVRSIDSLDNAFTGKYTLISEL